MATTLGSRGRITSIASRIMGLRISNKTEKALLVRIGTLIDAIVQSQRGQANAPGSLTRKANINNLKKPKALTGSTQNIFNGASVTITPTDTSGNLSHYEAQIDTDSNFSDPTSKETFTTSTTFKGLTQSTQYHIRIRPITKNGQVGDWASLDSIITDGTTTAADFDGDSLGATVLSKSFTFQSTTQDMFCVSNGGYQSMTALSLDLTADATGDTYNATAAQTQVDYKARRASTDIETVSFEGIEPTPVDGWTGSGSAGRSSIEGAASNIEVRRWFPLVFFNLMQASSSATFPVSYTFDVQVQIQGGGYNSSTYDTIWVQF